MCSAGSWWAPATSLWKPCVVESWRPSRHITMRSISPVLQPACAPGHATCSSGDSSHAAEQRASRRLQVGADLCMGSLIKSPGGTLATTGGYIAGCAELVAAAGARLTAPGVGLDAGAVPSETLRLMYQGGVPCLGRWSYAASGATLISSMGHAFGRHEAGACHLPCRLVLGTTNGGRGAQGWASAGGRGGPVWNCCDAAARPP